MLVVLDVPATVGFEKRFIIQDHNGKIWLVLQIAYVAVQNGCAVLCVNCPNTHIHEIHAGHSAFASERDLAEP